MGTSVQNELIDIQNHVVDMTRAGAFDGHPGALKVYAYYCLRVAIHDQPSRKLRRGQVMTNCTDTHHVASSCGMSERSVRTANTWLVGQRMIERVGSEVEIRTHDDQSEEWRKRLIAEMVAAKTEMVAASAEMVAGATVVDLRKHRGKDLTKDSLQSGGTK